tara:strand:- start:506 stop:661 length:156 start_codon:yes stop_codon:yes gene_type:complete
MGDILRDRAAMVCACIDTHLMSDAILFNLGRCLVDCTMTRLQSHLSEADRK